ncbi:MAG: LysM peptidoglycan-binding domain-containing protein [Acidimicrobiales bacterium]
MTLTPLLSAGAELAEAYLEIVKPPEDEARIPLRFNPSEYQIKKANNFAEIAIPGLESPPIQYIRGGAETLSTEFLVDTSDSMDDVRKKYVDAIRGLMTPNSALHAPPIVAFVWEDKRFEGVLESLDITYNLFDQKGVPLRARLAVTIKEYRPAAVQVQDPPRSSPDVDKSWLVRRGDTLQSIAGAVYRDPGRWRTVAEANGIADPRRLQVGTELRIPRLR